jgi:hypothetical protein
MSDHIAVALTPYTQRHFDDMLVVESRCCSKVAALAQEHLFDHAHQYVQVSPSEALKEAIGLDDLADGGPLAAPGL